ncbi:MAG: hypothetical protein MK085_01210, partial [Phycisphaerales bacterium]|nr:hypothetical protein [Phycisphaerales bacterium]
IFRLVALALSLLTPLATQAQVPSTKQGVAERNLRDQYLPSPVDPSRIRTLVEELKVDDPKDIDDAIERYKRNWNQLEDGPARIVRSRWSLCFEVDPQTGNTRVEWIPELLELLEARSDLFMQAEHADRMLFNELAITDDGSGSAEIARFQRTRRRELLACPEELPGTAVDLVADLRASGLSEESLLEIRPWIDEWEKAVVRETETRWAAILDLDFREAQEMVELGPGWQEVLEPGEVAEVRHRKEMFSAARRATELPLRQANTVAINRLIQLLPPDVSAKFTHRFRTATQPDLLADEMELSRLTEMITRLIARSPDSTPESNKETEDAVRGFMAITSLRIAELDADGCRLAERLRTLQMTDATAIARGGSLPAIDESGLTFDDRIDILQTRIEILRIDRKRRRIIDEMAKMLAAAIPQENMRSSTARKARAFIDSNTVLDEANAWRIEQLEDAIRQLEFDRQNAVKPPDEPAIVEAAN